MAKGRSGGLGKGLDALLSSTASETMQKAAVEEPVREAPIEPAIQPDVFENANPAPVQNAEKRTTERIQVYDEELEQLAAAERDAINRSKENLQEQSTPEWASTSAVVEVSTEAVATAPVIERVPTKKPTKRTAASESIKAQNNNIKPAQEHVETANTAPQPSAAPAELKDSKNRKLNEDSVFIALDSIRPNPNQPRTRFNANEIEELSASIEKDGLLQPILVRPVRDDTYEIIAGERRWHACKKAGLKEVPVRIKQVDDVQALELALVENIQRSDLNPIEEAYGYRRIMEHKKVTQSQLAQMVSKGRSTIANALRLLDLPEDAQQLLYEEKITPGHARAILSVPTAEGRQKLTDKLVAEKLSVRETENIARLLAGREKKDSNGSTRTPTPKEFKMVARQLRMKLGTNVQVKTVQGKNKIVIEFQNTDDLERLYQAIAGSTDADSPSV